MDQLIAIPVGIYLLEKSGTHEDIDMRCREILLYVSSCGNCLHQSKMTGNPPACRNFCLDCFSEKEVCENHKDLYEDIWLCDERPCEYCTRLIRNGSNITCTRFRTMVSFSD